MTESEFPHLHATARRLGGGPGLERQELRALLCHDCNFYTPDHEENLECSCFSILARMLERGLITPAGLSAAVAGGGGEKK